MATKHIVKFYPVGHGDTSQIILNNGRRILFDFNHSSASDDSQRPEINLKAELRAELTAAGRDYFDVVAFTHADLDHIQGSTTSLSCSMQKISGRRSHQDSGTLDAGGYASPDN